MIRPDPILANTNICSSFCIYIRKTVWGAAGQTATFAAMVKFNLHGNKHTINALECVINVS